jgi:phosphoenolpyruvate synthase/pyruvate phosphate dikinase
MTVQSPYVRWFNDLRLSDVPLVGGKNASLGELYSGLTAAGVRVPNGFALTAEAYREVLTDANAWPGPGEAAQQTSAYWSRSLATIEDYSRADTASHHFP